jgi:hypothetical protein
VATPRKAELLVSLGARIDARNDAGERADDLRPGIAR